MHDFKQFILLFILNIKMAYLFGIRAGFLFMFSVLMYVIGFYSIAYTSALFFWCVAIRPSVEYKNGYYFLRMARYALLVLPINWLIIHYFYHNWVACGIVLPVLICINLYILDSGFRTRRLLYAVVGVFRMYGQLLFSIVPFAIGSSLASTYVGTPITILVLLPCIVVMTSLMYYKSLFEEFRIYYAEI